MKSLLLFLAATVGAQTPVVSGDAELWGAIGGKPLVIRTTSRLAGAIDSVKWGGVEFIDSHDHGRQLQSAINADIGGVYRVECYNPTEAGSVVDALGPKSTSRLEFLSVQDGVLSTRTRMAFWLAPGMKSHGHLAFNDRPLSDHVLTKQVRIGRPGMDHVLDYRVKFTVPADRPHTYLQVEGLTGYALHVQRRTPVRRADLVARPVASSGRRAARPVVLSTPSGDHAMGVFTPDRPPAGQPAVGYGRFKFEHEKVVKWNCVFRLRSPAGIKPGDYGFQLYVVLGTREDCRRTLAALTQEFGGR